MINDNENHTCLGPQMLKAFEHVGVKRRWQICQHIICYLKTRQGKAF